MSDKKYNMIVTEKQLRMISYALEEYFRLRMGQEFDFVNDISHMDVDLSPDNPNHERIFDHMIHRRDVLSEIMHCFFRVAFAPYGVVPQKKTEEMMIAEDIWDAIRVATGRCDYPLYISSESVPYIEEVQNENEGHA